jgi:hypothetical protein
MLITAFAALAALAAQDPAPGIINTPVERSEAQAQLDVCLYTPAESRDPTCHPMLEAEAALVPDEAFAPARPSSLGWADIACAPDRLGDQSRTACRDEQRGLFRRAERARQALAQGAAGGVYAEAWSRPPAASSGTDDGLAFNRDERSASGPCDRRSSVRRDEDTGDSSSSYSLTCSWTNGSPDNESAARQALDAVMGWDRR